jgi:hypothetical protein
MVRDLIRHFRIGRLPRIAFRKRQSKTLNQEKHLADVRRNDAQQVHGRPCSPLNGKAHDIGRSNHELDPHRHLL